MLKIEQILEHIKNNPGHTVRDISGATGIGINTVRTHVSSLRGRGDIEIDRNGNKPRYYPVRASKKATNPCASTPFSLCF